MKILLVEDSRAVAVVMASRLASFGYEVSIAENGRIAVERFAALAPDLVLMDIEMPEMNGFEATNRIRALEATQQWAWTPILFLTASDTPENLVTAIEAGGDDFIAKTVPEIVLQAKMKAMARIATLREKLSIANRLLGEQASRDGLTGLCNRRYMDIRLDAAWASARDHRGAFGLLMLDVDNFKKYNDRYGHQAGDDCLRAIADAVGAVVELANANKLTDHAFVARYGGEEFAVILPDVTRDAYRQSAELIVDAVRTRAIVHEQNAGWGIVTVSVGGARQDVSSGKVVDLFRAADAHLYRAKAEGRNRAVLDD
jgi:diguanylate cyclase (GGDEF)-like protein